MCVHRQTNRRCRDTQIHRARVLQTGRHINTQTDTLTEIQRQKKKKNINVHTNVYWWKIKVYIIRDEGILCFHRTRETEIERDRERTKAGGSRRGVMHWGLAGGGGGWGVMQDWPPGTVANQHLTTFAALDWQPESGLTHTPCLAFLSPCLTVFFLFCHSPSHCVSLSA